MFHHSNPQADNLPNCLFDAVELGLFARLSNCGEDPLTSFRHELAARGLLKPGDDPHRLEIAIDVAGAGPVGRVDAILHVQAFGSGDLIITSGSSIWFNAMRLLRGDLGASSCGSVGLDGKDNVVGPTRDRAIALLGKQLNLIRSGLDDLVEAMEQSLPERAQVVAQQLWIRSAEVCLDLPCDRAISVVRCMQRAALPGTSRTVLDRYFARIQAEDLKGLPVVRWYRTLTGPAFKAYGKRVDILRAEIACEDRDAIYALLRARPVGEISGSESVELLLAFARAAEPWLGELVAHLDQAVAGGQSVADLIVALKPLVDLASGGKAAKGRPPSAASVASAREALDALLSTGVICAKGHRLGTCLRTVLDCLAASEGPLVRQGHHAIYTLRPEFATAASNIGNFGMMA